MHLLDYKFSDDELISIEDLAGCNYSPEKIALYLEIEKKLFLQFWYKKDSEVRKAYDRGQLVAEYKVNSKQKELAESGNITAAQIFLKESENTKIENIRNQILFGHDVD